MLGLSEKLVRRVSRAGLVAAFGVFSGLAVCAPAFADAGWVLTQRSATFGDQYLYISKNGLKCQNPKAGTAFVTHAPDWNVTIYNEKTKVYYQTTIDKWKAEMQARGMGQDMQNKNWSKTGNTNICGLKATEYKMTGANTLHLKGKRAQSISGANYWIADDITVPPQLTQLLATAYGLPTTQNVPLRLQMTESGKQRQMLDTYHFQASDIPIAYFNVPSGLTAVKSDAEVMMNDEQKEIFKDMARDFEDIKSKPATAAAPAGSPIPAATTASAPASSGNKINVGGMNLDKDKVQKFLDAFKKH